MVRKQKVYEIGTLLSRRTFIGEGQVASFPTENGIIIDRVRMKGRYPVEYRYIIQWDNGEKQHMRPKSLKGYVKSGYIEILSEG
jgi:hypothetical protein